VTAQWLFGAVRVADLYAFPVLVQNRDRTMCRFTIPSDACTPGYTLVSKGPVQQALLHCNNARAAGRTQARRLLRFDTQASIAAS
jgi:hypothetical protein